MWVWSLGWEDILEKKMATHSSILTWRIPWTEEPSRLQSIRSQRDGHNWSDLPCTHTIFKVCNSLSSGSFCCDWFSLQCVKALGWGCQGQGLQMTSHRGTSGPHWPPSGLNDPFPWTLPYPSRHLLPKVRSPSTLGTELIFLHSVCHTACQHVAWTYLYFHTSPLSVWGLICILLSHQLFESRNPFEDICIFEQLVRRDEWMRSRPEGCFKVAEQERLLFPCLLCAGDPVTSLPSSSPPAPPRLGPVSFPAAGPPQKPPLPLATSLTPQIRGTSGPRSQARWWRRQWCDAQCMMENESVLVTW